MKMKRTIIIIAALACLCGCAKTASTGKNDAAKKFFDAWAYAHKQDSWKQTPLGSWIMEEKAGTGEKVGEFSDSLFLRFNYTYTDLDGNVQGTSVAKMSQQLGTYVEGNYYGPQVFYAQNLYAGFEEILKDTRVGGKFKAAIPGWLATTKRYDSAEKYLEKESGDDGIYEIELTDIIYNLEKWEIDSIETYISRNFKGIGDISALSDTTGFYYVSGSKVSESAKALEDTTVYINYTGRLLDGTVFDTSIRDTAMRYGLFSEGRTYGPVSFNVKSMDKYSEAKMGDEETSTIKGFARTVTMMHAFESGSGIFFSNLGYGYNGSGDKIPAYSPLRFDIQLVRKPNE